MPRRPKTSKELREQLDWLKVSAEQIDAAQAEFSDVAGILQLLGRTKATWANGKALHELTEFQIRKIIAGEFEELRCDKWILRDYVKGGGQGKVFVCRDSDLNRLDVLKFLGHCDAHNLERFRREVGILAHSSHPGLPRIHSFGMKTGDSPFFAMERIDGNDLESLIDEQKQQYSILEALRLIYDLSDALAYLHENDVIHRDIKPANIILTNSGRLVLVDLGIAKVNSAMKVTQKGDRLGCAPFMSPEQFDDPSNVSPASDIYSLGCTFYFLLTGETPFSGNWDELRIAHETHTPPRIQDSIGHVPEGAEALYRQMVGKSPESRVQTAAELRQRLGDLIDELPEDSQWNNRSARGVYERGGSKSQTESAIRVRQRMDKRQLRVEIQFDDFSHHLAIIIDTMKRSKQQGW